MRGVHLAIGKSARVRGQTRGCTRHGDARKAEFSRAELVAVYGLDSTDLLEHLAAPDCSRRDNQWDRCGVYYLNPLG
jgi:hypothetical protein